MDLAYNIVILAAITSSGHCGTSSAKLIKGMPRQSWFLLSLSINLDSAFSSRRKIWRAKMALKSPWLKGQL